MEIDTRSILIVDDYPMILVLLERILAHTGYDLRMVTTAERALEAIVQAPPDVLICDLHLPGANGLWLIDRVRERAPSTAVILATGDPTIQTTESLRRGIVAYLMKPFNPREVIDAVETAMCWSAFAAVSRATSGEQPQPLLGGGPVVGST